MLLLRGGLGVYYLIMAYHLVFSASLVDKAAHIQLE